MKMIHKGKFINTDEKGFPTKECTIATDEEDIYLGVNKYTCLIIDKNNVGQYEIIHNCIPYIYKKNENILYGWTYGSDFTNYIDNIYHSIHIDDRCVVGCLPEESKDIDMENEWQEYNDILEAQWDIY